MILNPDQNKTVKMLAVFLVVSTFIFFLGVALSVYFIFVLPMHKEKTTAIITNITNNSTSVKYEANGRIYEKTYTAYSSNYYVGKKIKIYYNKRKPYSSFISSFRYLSLIGPGIGIILMGVTGIFCLVFYKKNINM